MNPEPLPVPNEGVESQAQRSGLEVGATRPAELDTPEARPVLSFLFRTVHLEAGVLERTKTTKSETLSALRSSFAYCDRAFSSASDTALVETVEFPASRNKIANKAFLLNLAFLHTGEHYGANYALPSIARYRSTFNSKVFASVRP